MEKVTKKNVKPTLLNHVVPSKRSFGQRAADNLAKWAGSWTFILSFAALLVFWMLANTSWLIFGEAWDEKPFILLNLILSCLAAFQAPVILMSQNRQGEKDRQKAEYDYAVNRKTERQVEAIQKQLNRIERKLN